MKKLLSFLLVVASFSAWADPLYVGRFRSSTNVTTMGAYLGTNSANALTVRIDANGDSFLRNGKLVVTNTAGANLGLTVTTNAMTAAFGGANTLVVTNGQVGVGTGNPQASLELNGDSASGRGVQFTDTTGNANSRAWIIGNSFGSEFGDLSFRVSPSNSQNPSGSPKVTFNKSGNVGIGTTLPTAQLHVAGTALASNAIITSVSGTMLQVTNVIDANQGLTITTSALTAAFGGATTLVVTNGRVGVGVLPDKALHVKKVLNTSTVGAGEIFRLMGDDGNNIGNLTELGFGAGGTYSPNAIGSIVTSGAGFNIRDLYFTTRALSTDTAPIERMRITSAGNVGVGTASPASKFDVVGDIRASTTITATNGVASYATNQTIAVTATGITNTLSVNYKVWLTAATGLSMSNSAGVAVFTGQTIATLTELTLQPGGKLVGTAITGVGVNAW